MKFLLVLSAVFAVIVMVSAQPSAESGPTITDAVLAHVSRRPAEGVQSSIAALFRGGSSLCREQRGQTSSPVCAPDCGNGAGTAVTAPMRGQRGTAGARSRDARHKRRSCIASIVTMVLLSECASAPMTKGGSLSSYDNLTPSDGVLAKSLVHVSKDDVLAAKTVRILPTVAGRFAGAIAQAASPGR
jgi:hypothetical protein